MLSLPHAAVGGLHPPTPVPDRLPVPGRHCPVPSHSPGRHLPAPSHSPGHHRLAPGRALRRRRPAPSQTLARRRPAPNQRRGRRLLGLRQRFPSSCWAGPAVARRKVGRLAGRMHERGACMSIVHLPGQASAPSKEPATVNATRSNNCCVPPRSAPARRPHEGPCLRGC